MACSSAGGRGGSGGGGGGRQPIAPQPGLGCALQPCSSRSVHSAAAWTDVQLSSALKRLQRAQRSPAGLGQQLQAGPQVQPSLQSQPLAQRGQSACLPIVVSVCLPRSGGGGRGCTPLCVAPVLQLAQAQVQVQKRRVCGCRPMARFARREPSGGGHAGAAAQLHPSAAQPCSPAARSCQTQPPQPPAQPWTSCRRGLPAPCRCARRTHLGTVSPAAAQLHPRPPIIPPAATTGAGGLARGADVSRSGRRCCPLGLRHRAPRLGQAMVGLASRQAQVRLRAGAGLGAYRC